MADITENPPMSTVVLPRAQGVAMVYREHLARQDDGQLLQLHMEGTDKVRQLKLELANALWRQKLAQEALQARFAEGGGAA